MLTTLLAAVLHEGYNDSELPGPQFWHVSRFHPCDLDQIHMFAFSHLMDFPY